MRPPRVTLIFPCLLAAASTVGEGRELVGTQVDSLHRVFPDRPPRPMAYAQPLSVPRGGKICLQFAVVGGLTGTAQLEASLPRGEDKSTLKGRITSYEIRTVPVEANNNGGSKSGKGIQPPEEWMVSFVREAPFRVAEVLVPAGDVCLDAESTHAFLLDLHVDGEADPGLYSGEFAVLQGEDEVRLPYALRVHEIQVPSDYALSTTYWLSPKPEDLTSGTPPPWWSEAHWDLLEAAGRCLREFGQDHIYTPILDGHHPLIQTIALEDGTVRFDFSRFDRWMDIFLGLGFERAEGHHVGGGHEVGFPPMRTWGGVWARDEATSSIRPLFREGDSVEDWFAFLPLFYDALHEHLQERGWLERYVQCQLDEPRDPEEYERLARIARKHLPGIPTKDAINSRPQQFSPLVDVHVFSLLSLANLQELVRQRREKGQSIWLYHCCSPYPPHPNRHLDERLSDSRLYPWLAFMLGADGYLYWAANMYRGADPYETSVGPLPNGSQKPGHPPGDNWFFYPGSEGLLPSMRMIAFREGLLDHLLLTALQKRDSHQAQAILQTIVRSIQDYEKDPSSFHRARTVLLEALEGRP